MLTLTHHEKMKKTILLFSIITIIVSCNSPKEQAIPKGYKIIYDEGIYVEEFDSTHTSSNRYTADNRTYLKGNKLTYDYYYQDLSGNKHKFQEVEGASELDSRERAKAWFLVNIDSLKDKTIHQVVLTVIGTNSWWEENNPDYNQTVISYKYPQLNGHQNFSSSTGVIENEKNVWIHPPRDKLFRILEINPFPFIQAPYEIGNKWEWSMKIGEAWGDSRWKTWEESIENSYEYEITAKREISTKLGDLECYEIKARASSSIGETHLTAFFHLDIGFVKLDYTNIDATKTVLELVKFEKTEQLE